MRASHGGHRRFAGYEAEPRELGPFDWNAGEHVVPITLGEIRGPASYRGRKIALEWFLVCDVKKDDDDVLASAVLPIEIAPRERNLVTSDVVVRGYREAPRYVTRTFEPVLGPRHEEGSRAPKLSIGERIEAALASKRDFDIQLEASPARAEPGDAIDVTLFLFVRSEVTLQHATATLCHSEEARDDIGTVTDSRAVADAELTRRVALGHGHRRFKTRFTLPDDAAASYADDEVATEWVVRVVVQPEWSAPLSLEFVLTVI